VAKTPKTHWAVGREPIALPTPPSWWGELRGLTPTLAFTLTLAPMGFTLVLTLSETSE